MIRFAVWVLSEKELLNSVVMSCEFMRGFLSIKTMNSPMEIALCELCRHCKMQWLDKQLHWFDLVNLSESFFPWASEHGFGECFSGGQTGIGHYLKIPS